MSLIIGHTSRQNSSLKLADTIHISFLSCILQQNILEHSRWCAEIIYHLAFFYLWRPRWLGNCTVCNFDILHTFLARSALALTPYKILAICITELIFLDILNMTSDSLINYGSLQSWRWINLFAFVDSKICLKMNSPPSPPPTPTHTHTHTHSPECGSLSFIIM